MLGISHLILLPLAVYALGVAEISITSKLVLFIAFGLFFGMISHSNAHELIHRTNRLHNRLGKWIFISILFGHHTSAHLLVHHPYVATPKDPNTARLNESFYTFLKRASVAEFIEGLRVENMRLKKKNLSPHSLSNPYWQYCIGGAAAVFLAYYLFDITAALTFIALCTYAQLQMLMIDYVQHYGLMRKQLENGKYEPVTPRHSDHHASPIKPFTDLDRLSDIAPQLPHSIPYMACIALWPRKWRSIMNPRVQKWQSSPLSTSETHK